MTSEAKSTSEGCRREESRGPGNREVAGVHPAQGSCGQQAGEGSRRLVQDDTPNVFL